LQFSILFAKSTKSW